MVGDYLKFQVEQLSAVTLLRSEQASFIIGFFQDVFGETQCFQLAYTELVSALAQYNEINGSPLSRQPSEYIESWANEKHRYLRKYYVEGNDEPQTELSYEISSLISWLRGMGSQDFVGAESRVSSLFQMIDKLASYSDNDPKTRIAKLERDREVIDQEIHQIKKNGKALGWDDLRKREYLSHIIEDSRRLFADFALIEDIFKEHARQLKEKMISAELSKGEILAQLLDMHDALEESDQGKSFRSFWNFLMSSSKQEELSSSLNKILSDITENSYLKGIQHKEYLARLKGFKADLLQRGRKVLASQNRLTREIRNLLVRNSNQDSRSLQSTMNDIKVWCITRRENFANIASEILVEIELSAYINLPLERPLWSKFNGTTLDLDNALNEFSATEAEIEPKNKHPALTLWQLEDRIRSFQKTRSSFSLPEILEAYPPEFVLEELVAYLAIGMKNEQHQVEKTKTIQVNDFSLAEINFYHSPKITNKMREKKHVKVTS